MLYARNLVLVPPRTCILVMLCIFPTSSGGTGSDAVILAEDGQIVGQAKGPGTNPWVSQ